MLTGKIYLDETKSYRYDEIDFNIKYSKDEFLRINVGEINLLTPYKEKLKALKELMDAISIIRENDNLLIGTPLAFYYIEKNGYLILYCDWAFINKEEYLEELKNNTMYEDAYIENLIIINEEYELQKRK